MGLTASRWRWRACIASTFAALSVTGCLHDDVAQPAGGTASFTAVAPLPGDVSSAAAAVSADGRVVAGSSRSRAGLPQAFRWTIAEGARPLGVLPNGSFTTAAAMSASGDVIVGNADGGVSGGLHVFRWTSQEGLRQLDELPNATLCVGSAVSGDGSVIAGTCLAPSNIAFRWSAATGPIALARLGPGSSAASTASAISQDGTHIGGSGHPVLTGAVIWDASNTPLVLGALAGDSHGAITALSRDGSVAAGASVNAAGQDRGFRWTSAGAIAALATVDAFSSTTTTGISGDGRRIVGWASPASGGPDVAVLWDESGQLRPVADLLSPDARAATAGWSLTRARAISSDGRVIVGEGIDPDGAGRGWIVTLDR
jgi:probable HAF family extracellular repeat protein